MLAAVRALPVESLFAADIRIAGDIQFLAKRAVFVQHASLFPLSSGFFHESAKRAGAQTLGLCGPTWAGVLDFARANGVDYALVSLSDCPAGRPREEFPIEELRPPELPQGVVAGVLQFPPEAIVASVGNYRLLHLNGTRMASAQ